MSTPVKEYSCPQCDAAVVVGGEDTVVCRECRARLVVDYDADWDSWHGWKDLTSLSLMSGPLSAEDVKLNGMDDEAADYHDREKEDA